MATYAIINQETCIGCGNCEGLAPTIFDRMKMDSPL